MPDDLPSRLDNSPPEPILPEPAELEPALDIEDKALFDRLKELELGRGQIPEITDAAVAARATSFVAQCRLAVADLGKAHKRRKAPLLALTRFLDNRYLRRRDRFEAETVKPVADRIEAYRRQLEAEQRKADAEARRRSAQAAEWSQREAQRLAAMAAEKERDGNRRAAVDLSRQAEAADNDARTQAELATLPSAPVRIHGEYGSTAFAVSRWKFYIADPEALPANLWTPDEAAIQAELDAALKLTGKPPEIPGVEFVEETQGRIRRC
jgi:hypothetical protein